MAERTEKFTVSEFGIVFNVKGDAPKVLKQMARDIELVGRNIKKTGRMASSSKLFGKPSGTSARGRGANMKAGMSSPAMGFGSAGGISKSANAMAEGAKSAGGFQDALSSVAFQADIASQKLGAVSNAILGTFANAAAAGVMRASEIERGINKLELMAKKKMPELAGTIYDEVENAGLTTVQTTAEVTDLAFGLMTAQVNPFTKAMKNIQLSTGQTVTAMETLSDVATIAPYGMQSVLFGLRDAMGRGSITLSRGLGASLDLSAQQLAKYNEALKTAKTPQEKFNALVSQLAEDYGGLAKAQENTFGFVLDQMDDVRDKVFRELFLGSGILDMLAESLKNVQKWFLEMIKSGRLEPIKKSLKDIFKAFLDVAGVIARAALAMFEFTARNPWVLKLVVYLGVALGVLAAIFAAAASIAAMGTAIYFAFTMVIVPIVSMMALLAPILVVVGAIVGALGLLARYMLKANSWTDAWNRFKLVVQGIREFITSMTGDTATLSEETATALHKAGLLQFVINIGTLIHKIGQFLKGLYEGFMTYFQPAVAAFSKVWDHIWMIATKVAGIFLELLGITGLLDAQAGSGAASWKDAGVSLGKIFGAIFWVLEKLLLVTDAVLTIIEAMVDIIIQAATWVHDTIMGLIDKALGALGQQRLGAVGTQGTGLEQYKASVDAAFNEQAARRANAEERAGERSISVQQQAVAEAQKATQEGKIDEKALAKAIGMEMQKRPMKIDGQRLNDVLGQVMEREEARQS